MKTAGRVKSLPVEKEEDRWKVRRRFMRDIKTMKGTVSGLVSA